jgi:hypothetical protein
VNGPAIEVPQPPPSTEQSEQEAVERLRNIIRSFLREGRLSTANQKEDGIARALDQALAILGKFYRQDDGSPLFFRNRTHRLYEINGHPESDFGRLITYLGDCSVKTALVGRCVDRLAAKVSENAEIVSVHGLAFDSPDANLLAVNDFGGGMWVRSRGGAWEWQPNGHAGILFWSPSELVEPWKPEFSGEGIDEDHLDWFLGQAHFADDILTSSDQRLLFRALLLLPFFPSRCRTRPVQAHLGLNQQRQYDTGKTMAGKMIGVLLSGRRFEPMPPPEGNEKGIEALQLALMHEPFVLLDNVDTEIKWLNDFLCTYTTGARPTKRKLYTDTQQVRVEYRGRLCLTSRKARFNRVDVASRTIPFRFAPIDAGKRKTERQILGPLLARREQIWAGILGALGHIQDALPTLVIPAPRLRLADFEEFGWCAAAVQGQAPAWESAMLRLGAAQAGFALEGEPFFPLLERLLADGDLVERPTSEFYSAVCRTGRELALDLALPHDAAACTKRLKELQEVLEARLDVKIQMRTLHGTTLVQIKRGPTWPEVTEVTEVSPSLPDMQMVAA